MTFGSLGVILVLGAMVTIMLGALKKLDIDVESKFEHGGYEFEAEGEFEIDKLGDKKPKKKRRGSERRGRGRDEPNFEEQPNQIDTERPMLVPSNVYPYPFDNFPYYNRFILW